MRKTPILNDTDIPLVSVLIFNYNYGKYLKQCLDSVINQTYSNIEICFSDNASDDNSWEIAAEYSQRYPGIINITRNRVNFGVYANFVNCHINARGKYYMQLGSDDTLMPEFIEQCVKTLESHKNLAFAMTHRMILDNDDNLIQEPPFYNQSCLIKGSEQAAVYMMAAVNPSVSQVLYNKIKAKDRVAQETLATRWYSQRIMDFNICCEFDIAYLKEPLMIHRIHNENDSLKAASNLMEVIGPYVLNQQFASTASYYPELSKVEQRLPASISKLSKLCLRYCIRALLVNNERLASKYYHLSAALDPDIAEDEIFTKTKKFWDSDKAEKISIVKELKIIDNFKTRTISYDPPPGSTPLK